MTDSYDPRPIPRDVIISQHEHSAGQYVGDLLHFAGEHGPLTIGDARSVEIDGAPYWTVDLTKTTKDLQSGKEEVERIRLDPFLLARTAAWFEEGERLRRTDEHFLTDKAGFEAIYEAVVSTVQIEPPTPALLENT